MGTGKLTRRDFIAAGAGAVAGIGAFGLVGGLAGRHREGGARGPASSTDFREWSLVSPREELFKARGFEAIVIGSGYGGAVTAARLASAGVRVCILERGEEWLPGDFPESVKSLLSSDRRFNPQGLLDFHMPTGSDMDVVSAAGVGGTSLINAAISSRPEPLVFEQPEWPEALRAAHRSGDLDRHYDAATRMLEPGAYEGPEVPKVAVQRKNAALLKGQFHYLPLNIRHADTQVEQGGRRLFQPECRLCGNCCSGCNYGSKNTLQANYLPLAVGKGARLFAGISAEWIERRSGGGYRVHYRAVGPMLAMDRAGTVDAGLVIVAGGSLGSTEILMRSAEKKGLRLSGALGTRVSANGDVLGFSYNGDVRTNLVGTPRPRRPSSHSPFARWYESLIDGVSPAPRKDDPVGTALMSYIDYRGANARGSTIQDRFLLIEGTVPTALSNLIAKALAAYARLNPGQLSRGQADRVALDEKYPLSAHPDGALNHSTLYLACGHDDSGGRYVHRPGMRPAVVWGGVGSERFVRTINATMKEHAEAQGGLYIPNPRSTLFDGRIMATHPLGGCPMGDDAGRGTVDHLGRVFNPAGGVHEGLYVCDGSIIPRSLGATPLLTISALAERTAEAILKGRRGG